MVSGSARIAGILGWPVAHSLSPKLHGYWLNHYGIDGAYIPLAVQPDAMTQAIKALPLLGFRGFNLTLPHKELVLPLLDRISDEARLIGAVNTVAIGEDGRLHGSNSDSYGFAEALRPHLTEARDTAIILGAGGASRAVCHALMGLGFSRIVVVNRNMQRAEALVAQYGSALSAAVWDERSQLLDGVDLLVNTTSLGMQGKEPLEIDLASLPAQAAVCDIVYAPLETPLLAEAKRRGHPVIDGLGMLLHQAVPGFEAWFGVRPEVTPELRAHLLHG